MTTRRAAVGGKAAALEVARVAGLPVPPFLVVTPQEAATLRAEAPEGQALLRAAAELGGHLLAVRSSAISEDGDASFAGQLESVVGVTRDQTLFDAIATVASSGLSTRVASYGTGIAAEAGPVAVIVQRHIQTVWAGVAFCRDPVTYQPEIVIEAVQGAGELLVGGSTTPVRAVRDRVTLDPLVAQDNWIAAPPDDVVRGVARLALSCEELFGSPQDIEWGWDGEDVWLLQSRPMTSTEGLEVYTDTFSSEVLPGLIKPLVFDVGDVAVNKAWGHILTAICGPIDVDWRRMAGLAASRAYFNDSLLGDVLNRAGLPENTLEAIEHGERPRLRDGSYGRMVASAGRLAAYLVRNARWLAILDRELPPVRARALELATGLETAQGTDVAERVRELLEVLEHAARLSALTMIAMGLHGVGTRTVGRLAGVDAQTLESAASGGVEPTVDIERVAVHLRRLTADDAAVVEAGGLAEIEAVLARTDEGAAALRAMSELLDRWGHVATVNTDFSAHTWRDDPTSLWRIAARTRSVAPACDWEQQRQALPWLVRGRVDRLRRHVAARDRVNDTLALTYDALRLTARRAGELLRPDVIECRDDVYFLRLEELLDALTAHAAPLHAEVAERRAALAADADVTPPHRLWGLRLPPRWRMLDGESVPAPDGFSGTAASAGRFVGTARVVTDLSSLPLLDAGDVLVVPHADIGWTPLFGAAGAVVTNSGGGLSHAAIVAREFGIPAVLGVSDATSLIPEGAVVLVDGNEGLVRILERAGRSQASRADEGENVCAT